ncbi:MAG: AAA family ATPase [Lachnospiraceae bacterium]|nr:AAA family ATPase [Lachnospiraceae bacterium]
MSVNTTSFEDILRENGFRLASYIDEADRKDIANFLSGILEGKGGATDAEVEAILESYIDLGLLDRIADGSEDDEDDAAPGITVPEDPCAAEQFRAAKTDAERAEAAGKAGGAAEPGAAADGSAEHAPILAEIPQENQKKKNISWQLFAADTNYADAEHPILVLADPGTEVPHHQTGAFTNPERKTAFEYVSEGRPQSAEIRFLDSRFVKLMTWLGEGHIAVRLTGRRVPGPDGKDGWAVYKIRAVSVNDNEILQTANNDFLQLVIRRILDSRPKEAADDDERDSSDAGILLTDMAAMIDYVNVAEDTLPDNVRNWAHRNIAMAKSKTVSQEEKRHAQRALSMMLNIRWQGSYFEPVDPAAARRILDEELYGMEKVKQRVIETIIQINRTHTLPVYGLLLVGPAGTGKSQIAYAVARILKLPWTSLDMSAITDVEQLTGTPRVYTNAKPGHVMESLARAGASNLVFIINELDKADSGRQGSNPADALLTLLDNLGFTDNYIECQIPTAGVYPIATANDRRRISAPLLSRFAEIEIHDYTPDEKRIIFTDFSMPKILKRMGMMQGEMSVTPGAVDAVIERFRDETGVRDLEQAAEHLAAHALYRIETEGISTVRFDETEVRRLLEL